ncbi:hypothetical protein GAH_01731 [Geoglobus ahangari]|uniref:Uncharacterized protein n=1 Tax=Geoglobus ahangari TaxID=113653 RepID=A0A0F7IEZ0_9EURY|nr:hypothetical protein [Geoglobus ahangari]AKG90987.1 hypothetical protein GAH_01731 [Geoglobus ahangari]
MGKTSIVYLIIFLNTVFFLYALFENFVYSSVVLSEILLIVLYMLSKDKICLKLFAVPILVSGMLVVVYPFTFNGFFRLVWNILYFAQLLLTFTLPPACGARYLKNLEKSHERGWHVYESGN